MTPAQLIGKLGAAGIKLWLDDDGQLRFKAPKGALTATLKEQLIAQKQDVIAFLADAKGNKTSDTIPLLHRAPHQEYELSYAQQRFWFLDRLEPGNPSLHIPAAVRIKGPLNIERLHQAFTRLIERHEQLRVAFVTDEQHHVHQVVQPTAKLRLQEDYDLSHLPRQQAEERVQEILQEEALRPFHLNAPVDGKSHFLRARLARLSNEQARQGEYVLFVIVHHIIADGWSINLLISELAGNYHSLQNTQTAALPALDLQYIDYAHWQRKWLHSDRMQKQLQYWQQQLADTPVLKLPTDYPRPAQAGFNGASTAFTLASDTLATLQKLATSNNISFFSLALAAFKVLMMRHSGQKDFAIGTPVAGRNRKDIEPIIGCFINLLAIRSPIDSATAFVDYAKAIQQTLLTAQEHADIPFERVAEEFNDLRSLAHAPIFQVLFTLGNPQLAEALKLDELTLDLIKHPSQTAKYDLQLHLDEYSASFDIEYNTDLFSADHINDFGRHYSALLTSIAAAVDTPIKALNIYQNDDLQMLLPNPALPTFSSKTLLERLESQAYKTPGNIAVSAGPHSLTYQALHHTANGLAYRLIDQGVECGDRVGICVTSGVHCLTAILACIKSGAVYVPMDANYPRERLQHISQSGRLRIVLTDSGLADDFHGIDNILIDAVPLPEQEDAPSVNIDSHAALYTIYTSGSTGTPKGASVSHANEINLLNWYLREYQIDVTDKVLVISSPGFDLTQKNLLGPLLAGAEVVFAPQLSYDPQVIVDTIYQNDITLMNCAPSAFYPLVEHCQRIHRLNYLGSLRHLLFGGEPITLDNLAAWINSNYCNAQITNMYGPTECTDITTAYTLPAPRGLLSHGKTAVESNAGIPIGQPIDGVNTYVLDDDLNLVPAGATGELYIGGLSVGLGYFEQPDLTAETFIDDPYNSQPGAKMYRTHDLVRVGDRNLPLQLSFVSRTDDQIKLRGFRIELGEIQSQIEALPAIEDALVVVNRSHGSPRLIAYYKAADAEATAPMMLRDALKRTLPDYMLPAAFVMIDQWPLSPNGKIDKKALPEPESRHKAQAEYVAPRNLTETQLVDIWRDLLEVEAPGVDDNFFELGGHSLLATQLVGTIAREFGIEVPLKAFFENATIAALGDLIDHGHDVDALAAQFPLTHADREQPICLSPAQERLWIIEQVNPGTSVYNIPMGIRLQGALDQNALATALQQLVERHESLRTRIGTDADGMPRQQIAAASDVRLSHHDVSGDSDPQQAAQAFFDSAANQAFDLANDILFRVDLLKLDDNEYWLIACMHHMIADGWSLTILQQDLIALYHANCSADNSALAPLEFQYADVSVWQRDYLVADKIQQQLDYWLDKLTGAPPLINLPTDRPRPAQQTFNGAMLTETLSPALTDKLRQFSQQQGTTHFNTLLALYSLLLSKYANQQDICIGTPVSGREHPALQNMIGYFVNAVVIRQDLSGNPSVLELCQRTQDQCLGAFAHQHIPIEQILEKLPLERNLSYPPVTQVGFSFIGETFTRLQQPDGLNISPVDYDHVLAKYDITLIVIETADGFSLNAEYNTDLYDADTVQTLVRHYTRLIDAALTAPDAQINALQLFDQHELAEACGVANDNVEAIYPLTAMQYDMVMGQQLNPDGRANTLGYRIEPRFAVDQALWQQALQCLCDDELTLRTEFRTNRHAYGEFAYQVIFSQRALNLEVFDYRTECLTAEQIDQRIDEFIYQPQHYQHNRYFRYALMQITDDHTVLLMSCHHAILDGIAVAHAAQLHIDYYEALLADGHCRNAKRQAENYPQYILDNRQKVDNAQTRQFWSDKLANCSALDFPQQVLRHAGEQPHHQVRRLDIEPALWAQIKSFCRKQRTQPVLYFKMIYGLLIANYCRVDSDFFFTEFHAKRNKTWLMELGCFFQQSPFVFPQTLLDADTDIKTLVRYASQHHKETRAAIDISAGLVNELAPKGRLQFMYNYYHFLPQAFDMQGERTRCAETPPYVEGAVQFIVKELDNEVMLDLYFQDGLFDDYDFLERFRSLNKQIIKGADTIADLNFTLKPEFMQQVYHQTHTQRHDEPFASAPSVHSLFEAQAARTPDAIAIHDDNGTITYQSLNQRANQLAHHLHDLGVGADVRVGIGMPRCIDAMVGILAVLKAGGAYVPIDANYPTQRIQHMLATAQIHILLTLDANADNFAAFAGDCLILDTDNAQTQVIRALPTGNLPANTDAQDMLYVIFTSGSTGLPKGAAVTHAGEINLLQWYTRELALDANSRVLIISALGFDLTQKNLFAPLVSGSQLILSAMPQYDSQAIHNLISQHQVTTINCAPSAFYPLVEDHTDLQSLASLKDIVFGGEAIKAERLQNWVNSNFCQVRLSNNYGPTECTDIAAFYPVTDIASWYDRNIPVGRANDNVKVYVMNNNQQLLPTGLIGEICIAGAGVGRGYLNHDALNQQKFLPDPFGDGQLYRTGDLGRYLPDGTVEFVARDDFQVKINGQRIELGEIEHAVQHQAGVLENLVMLQDNQLVAYAVCEKTYVNLDHWRNDLTQHLPAFMIPQHFVLLESWPLTANGKIDRKALPTADQQTQHVEYIAPRDDTEAAICQIVARVLGVDRVGVLDNFFELGGHSLAASRAVVQIREHFNIDIPLNLLFDMTTPEKLATYIKASQWAAESAKAPVEETDDRDVGFI